MLIADRNQLARIRTPWVTLGLLATCCLVYLAQVANGGEAPPWLPFQTGDILAHPTAPATWLGVVAYAVMHANFLHLAGNMLSLWVFGDNVEDAFGHWRYALLLLASAIAGAVLMAFTAPPETVLIGASGAIAGVMAAYLLLYPHARLALLVWKGVPVQVPAGWFVGVWFCVNLVRAIGGVAVEAPGQDTVAWMAHIGGFLTGLALTVWARPQGVALFQPEAAPASEGWLWTRTWYLGPPADGDWTGETVAKAALFLVLVGVGMLVG